MKTPSWYDSFILDDKNYTIVGVQGTGYIKADNFGLTPVASDSSNGWGCTFCLRNDNLILNEISVFHGHIEDGKMFIQVGPEINGVKPIVNRFEDTPFADALKSSQYYPNGYFSNTYQGLNLGVEFTGGVLMGRKYIYGSYSGTLYSRILEYEKVVELILKRGKVIEKRDVSPQIQELRDNRGIISDFVPY